MPSPRRYFDAVSRRQRELLDQPPEQRRHAGVILQLQHQPALEHLIAAFRLEPRRRRRASPAGRRRASAAPAHPRSARSAPSGGTTPGTPAGGSRAISRRWNQCPAQCAIDARPGRADRARSMPSLVRRLISRPGCRSLRSKNTAFGVAVAAHAVFRAAERLARDETRRTGWCRNTGSRSRIRRRTGRAP